MTRYLQTLAIATLAVLASCHTAKDTSQPAGNTAKAELMPGAGQVMPAYIPKATIYKTNGDYADNVAITVSNDGQKVLSYPAPSDVSAASAALPVGHGWLLDRRGGISENTVFTRYTYAEYAKLPEAPSCAQLLESVIPGAKVTEIKKLPITYQEAIDKPSLVKKYAK